MRTNFERQVCGEQARLARPQHTYRGAPISVAHVEGIGALSRLNQPRRRRGTGRDRVTSSTRMMSHIGYPLAVPRSAWRCLLTGSWGWPSGPRTTQRSWLTTFASTLISLSFRVVRQAVIFLARSPKPAGRLWHSPHSARTLRSAASGRIERISTKPPPIRFTVKTVVSS